MAQSRSGATDFAQSTADAAAPSQSHPGGSDIQRTNSTMSQSHTLTPSRGGTLKKRQSLSRKNSLKRSGSRRNSRPGSVRSLTFADGVDGHGSEMNSAFYTPVPTTGTPTEILANRFQVWRKVLKDLITYFTDIKKTYEARSKSLYTLSNVAMNISTPAQLVTEGGIGDALHILRDYHKKTITESNKAKSIEEEIIVQLTGLRSDLGQKIKEIKSLAGDFKNNVDKETEATRRAVRDLQDALSKASTDPKSDPYLVRLSVDRQLSRQIEEENYLHRAFLNLESSGRELESIVMGEIQKAYNAYAGILKREADEAYEAIESLRSGPLGIPKDYEWNAFVDNNEHFVDPRLPVRRLENITYPGQDDAAASEVKAGMLERKSKYLKSYTPGWYVLSTTHLHEFKSPDHIASQSPVMSLPLADQKLGSHSGPESTSHKFMLKGRQSGGIHRGHAWVFRAESYDTMLAWFEDIKNLTEKTGAERSEFIRRSHARSLSAGSNKAGSISSDGMDEDEADQVPYSATASQAEIPAQKETVTERPNPGGRFPSAINVNRDSQVPVASSSPSSSDDREIVAAAGALPGSGVPFGDSGHQVKTGDDETNATRGELAGASTAPQLEQAQNNLPFRQGQHPGTTLERHDSKYGDWMGPAAIGVDGGVTSAAGIEAYRLQQAQNKVVVQEEEQQPGSQAVEATPQVTAPAPLGAQKSVDQSMNGGITTEIPPTIAYDFSSTADRGVSTALGGSTSKPADPALPIKDLADRPPLESHTSVATISELHVPGEFPKGSVAQDSEII